MAGTNALDLQDLCQELLAASVEALDTIPTFSAGLAGAPQRSFVSSGTPVFEGSDCPDQLTVHASAIFEVPSSRGGLAEGTKQRSARQNLVQLVVTIARCVCDPNASDIPPPESLQDAAEQTNADAWSLWNHLWNLQQSGDLFTLCGLVFWRGARALNPSGCVGGWTLTFDVQLDGYQE